MKTELLKILTLGLLLAGGATAFAQSETNSSMATDQNSFRIITERNIFNPTRRGVIRRTDTITRRTQVDSFKLVGTMDYEKGKLAFFDGTSSEFRRTLKPSDIIAGYRIADIKHNEIKLLASSNSSLTLPVGAQMRRTDGGPWSLISKAEPVPGADAMPTDNPDLNAKAATLNGAETDAMKRLLMRRMQEK